MRPLRTRRFVSWSRDATPLRSLLVSRPFLTKSWASGSLACAIAPEAAVSKAAADTVARTFRTPFNRIRFPQCHRPQQIAADEPRCAKAILRGITKPSEKNGRESEG